MSIFKQLSVLFLIYTLFSKFLQCLTFFRVAEIIQNLENFCDGEIFIINFHMTHLLLKIKISVSKTAVKCRHDHPLS